MSQNTLRRRAVPAFSSSTAKSDYLSTFRKLDVYPKLEESYSVKTSTGATVSLVSGVIMLVLFLSEFASFMTVTRKDHIVVDTTMGEKLRINFNITFFALTCAEVNVVSMDVAGDIHMNIDHGVFKTRLDPSTGRPIGQAFRENITEHKHEEEAAALPADYCGSCYGAATSDDQCCNSCADVRDAYSNKGWGIGNLGEVAEQCVREAKNPAMLSKAGEGCLTHGHVEVNKVSGNFHIALGKTITRDHRLIHQFSPNDAASYNCSHRINALSFGEPFPGRHDPLDGTTKVIAEHSGVFQYFIKIVPTEYRTSGGAASSPSSPSASSSAPLKTNQFSITDQFRPVGPINLPGGRVNRVAALPGVFFIYDLSPFMVQVTETTVPFTHFLTSVCAIVGGVFTIAGIVDSALYHVPRRMAGKGL